MTFNLKNDRVYLVALAVVLILFLVVLMPLRKEISETKAIFQKTYSDFKSLKVLEKRNGKTKVVNSFAYGSSSDFSLEIRKMIKEQNLNLVREVYQNDSKNEFQLITEISGSSQNQLSFLIKLENLSDKIILSKCEFKPAEPVGVLKLEIKYRVVKN